MKHGTIGDVLTLKQTRLSKERQAKIAGAQRRLNRPSIAELESWMNEGGCEATDGCWVEPDGTCPHGCKSWLLVLGMI